MKILIIEDDKSVAQALLDGLKQNYLIDLSYSGHKGVFKALTTEYDFIILDLKLPDTDGFQICRELRREGLTIPILILTGKELPESKVVLLDAGADDYLVKPFNLAELRARLRALLRRTSWWTESDILQVEKLKLNLRTRTVIYNDHLLKLSKKEFLLLHFLMRHINVPLSRFKLSEHIWESQVEFNSNTIDVHICNLRKKMGKKGGQLLKTVYGSGYMLSAKNKDV